jgi:hypothetical protein
MWLQHAAVKKVEVEEEKNYFLRLSTSLSIKKQNTLAVDRSCSVLFDGEKASSLHKLFPAMPGSCMRHASCILQTLLENSLLPSCFKDVGS